MTKLKTVVLLSLALLTAPVAVAAGDKVVVLDMQTAILNTDVAKKRNQEMQANAEYAGLQARFDSLRGDLQKMAKDAEKNSVTWTPEQAGEYRKKMEYARSDLESVAKKLQAENNATAQRVLQELSPKAQVVVKDIIAADGIGLVLSQQAAYYAEPSLDITAKVTEKLNKAK